MHTVLLLLALARAAVAVLNPEPLARNISSALEFVNIVRSLTGSINVTVPAATVLNVSSVPVADFPPITAPGYLDSGTLSIVGQQDPSAASGSAPVPIVLDLGNLVTVSVSSLQFSSRERAEYDGRSRTHASQQILKSSANRQLPT